MFYDDVVFPTAGFSLEDVVDPTGAGDSFAGAMIGYLASKNSTSLSEIKKSVVYGNVLGSFAVEKYGLDGLLRIKKGDIVKRIKIYEKMIQF
jgi:sugar/nucleoside kinase (ribokinase family)